MVHSDGTPTVSGQLAAGPSRHYGVHGDGAPTVSGPATRLRWRATSGPLDELLDEDGPHSAGDGTEDGGVEARR
jgi:hypothetical protein